MMRSWRIISRCSRTTSPGGPTARRSITASYRRSSTVHAARSKSSRVMFGAVWKTQKRRTSKLQDRSLSRRPLNRDRGRLPSTLCGLTPYPRGGEESSDALRRNQR
jgi:hypothetical protein